MAEETVGLSVCGRDVQTTEVQVQTETQRSRETYQHAVVNPVKRIALFLEGCMSTEPPSLPVPPSAGLEVDRGE